MACFFLFCFCFFFFKQKTAYEIYQCDWSSDVCSSDLTAPACETQAVVAGALTTFTGTFVGGAGVAPTGVGLLRVTTEASLGGGGVGAQIYVDGVARDRWALNWLKLAPGVYEVCYGDVEGFTTPACEQVVVTAGATTAANGLFETRGILRVTTAPPQPATILVDGIPRNDWGFWADLPAGPHVVCFGESDGFTPACQPVTLTPGATTFVTGVWP